MKPLLARTGYTLLLRLLTPAYLARLWWRGAREPLYRAAWDERLGWYRAGHDGAPASHGAERVWIHAVSLGETRAAAALIDELRRQRPGTALLLTHGTATGREAGRALLAPGDAQAWLPYDTPGAVRRFLRRHKPALGVLMETEIWPNLLGAAREAGVPMVLANARLSEKSQRKGARLQPLLRPAIAGLTRTLAQTEADARRLRDAGVPHVHVAGNLKFDVRPDPALTERGRAWRAALARPVVLMASSRDGEEAALLEAWLAEARRRRDAGGAGALPLLAVVPRHPQRFDAVYELLRAKLPHVHRRSSFGADAPGAAALQADAWLGDSLGEMPLYYALADVALLGGSYAPLGGQNLIEAAACGCPVVAGPHTYNFAAATDDAIAAGAAQRAADIDAGVAAALALAADGAAAGAGTATQRERALQFAARHRGAAERMAAEVLALLDVAAARAAG